MGNCAQSQTLWSNKLLSRDVRSPHDEREAVKRWVGQIVIFEDRLKRAASSSMIELHLGEPRCVERNRSLSASRIEELVFRHEEELRLGIDVPPNQPRAGHPVDLDITARNPLHKVTSPRTLGLRRSAPLGLAGLRAAAWR